MRAFVTALLLVFVAAPALSAHGGIAVPPGPGYNPGGGTSKPGGGNPGKTGKNKGKGGNTKGGSGGPTTPPGGGGGPTTPPGDGPTTPPPGGPTTPPSTVPPAPTTPGAGIPNVPTGKPGASGGGAPAPAAPGRPSTGGGPTAARRAPTSNDRWETWWAHTRELYLGRHAGGAMLVQSGRDGFLTGRSSRDAAGSPLLPDDVRRDLMPVLARALRDSSTEVADSAAIALGRSVSPNEGDPILPLLVKNLAHRQRSPQEAAILGLGILGGAGAVDPLRQIALDQPGGRQLCGSSGPLDEFLRALAALSLGLVGTQDAMSPLVTLATTPSTSRELAAAAVAALGLQREAAPAAMLTLARLLDQRGLDREVRAQVPIAIARLPQASARGLLPRLLETLADRRTCSEVTRSIALALGHIVTPDDAEAVRALVETARRNDDAATRQFALLAIGRVYELHPVQDESAAKQRDAAFTFLVDQLRNPSQRSQRPWAGLALGLFGRGDSTFGTAAPSNALTTAARKMIETFEDDSDPSLQGALAIALGLLRSPAAPPVLRAKLQSTAHPGLRSHLATALGLLGDAESIEPLRELLADRSLPPSARVDVARGLALSGDVSFERRLLELLSQADDLPSAVAYAKSLGLVGSRASAEALRRMAEDASLPEVQRGFAVVAIGLLAEKTPLPWNVPYLVDANYTLPLRPLEEVLDLL